MRRRLRRGPPGPRGHAYPAADRGGPPAPAAPEMLRTPLQDLVLQVLKLGLGGPREFLGAAPQPPPTRAVDAALDDLLAIGCVARVRGEEVADDDDESSSDDDENPHGDAGELFSFSSAMLAESSHDEEDDEEDAPIEDDRWLLTPLGEHVASLPVDCRVGKLLIYGCVFGCADACLTAAAGMSLARGLWRAPPQLRREASLAKQRLAQGDGSALQAAVRAPIELAFVDGLVALSAAWRVPVGALDRRERKRALGEATAHRDDRDRRQEPAAAEASLHDVGRLGTAHDEPRVAVRAQLVRPEPAHRVGRHVARPLGRAVAEERARVGWEAGVLEEL